MSPAAQIKADNGRAITLLTDEVLIPPKPNAADVFPQPSRAGVDDDIRQFRFC
jgi:hypothetical protein